MKKSTLFLISSYILLVLLTTIYAVAAKNHYESRDNSETVYMSEDTIITSVIKHVVLLNRSFESEVYINLSSDTTGTSASIDRGNKPNVVQISGDTLFYSVDVGGGSLHLKNKVESIKGKNVRFSVDKDVLSTEQCSIELINAHKYSNYNSSDIDIDGYEYGTFSCKQLSIDLRNAHLNFRFYAHSNFNVENFTLNLGQSEFGIIQNTGFENRFHVGSMVLRADSLSIINVPTQCLMNMKLQ